MVIPFLVKGWKRKRTFALLQRQEPRQNFTVLSKCNPDRREAVAKIARQRTAFLLVREFSYAQFFAELIPLTRT
jgi:hypothetical protein